MIFIGLAGIFLFVVPMPEISQDSTGRIVKSTLQAVISGIIVLFWFYGMWQLRNFYVRRKILFVLKD